MKLNFGKEWFFWIALMAIFLSFNSSLKEGLYLTSIFAFGVVYFMYSFVFFGILFYEKSTTKGKNERKISYRHLIVMAVSFTMILIISANTIAVLIALILLFLTFLINAGGFVVEKISNQLRNRS